MRDTQAPLTNDRQPLPQLAWEEIAEPGAYVELTTGVLYRVPTETIAGSASPLIEEKADDLQPRTAQGQPPRNSRFVRVSSNPFIFSLGARLICAQHDIRPNF